MIAKVWQISEYEARRMLEVTSQLNHQDPDSILSRKFGTNNCILLYKRIITYFFSDTLWVTNIAKSTQSFTCMKLFISKKGFGKVYGMKAEKYCLQAIKLFYKEVEVPT